MRKVNRNIFINILSYKRKKNYERGQRLTRDTRWNKVAHQDIRKNKKHMVE